jgi:hypothetical protein
MMDMRSPRGFWAALAFLSALPLALLGQAVLGTDAEMVIPLVCAVGFMLLAFSTVDFRVPRWMRWIGCAAASASAAIYLLQGVSPVIQNDSLTFLAFQVFGQTLERVLTDLLILWFVALVLLESQGKTKMVGIIVMSVIVGLEVLDIGLAFLGPSVYAQVPILKALILLPFVWLLLESGKRISPTGLLHPVGA